MTTIVEFRNSKQRVTRRNNPDVFEDGDLRSNACWIYGKHDASYEWGYIEILSVHNVVDGELVQFTLAHLTLGCDEWISNDLADLEAKLYEWAKENGNFEPTPIEMRQRLLGIAEFGIAAFWKKVAEKYPECKSGDLGPAASREFEQAAYKVVTTWRDNNGGGQNV